VVTLDVTEQEQARQRRNEQLLRELTTILDGSTAGIAYLRGRAGALQPRFERMLGFAARRRRRRDAREAFGRRMGAAWRCCRPWSRPWARAAASRPSCRWPRARPRRCWYSLSVRRAEQGGGEPEAVAVLTDITRLKAQQPSWQLLRERELMFSLSEVGIVYHARRAHRARQPGHGRADRLCRARAERAGRRPSSTKARAPASTSRPRVAQGLREHGRFSGERRLRRRDGSLLWVQVAVRPVDADDGRRRRHLLLRRRRRAPPRARDAGRCRPSARAPSSTRCWWASSPWASAASSG
jgi:PAS domain-containing protein